jgi:class 3 adenylate cyclase/ActR/RegA family two-component response regulator
VNGKVEMFCVYYVDMESSTYNTACLRPEDYSVYYAAFYDTLSDIAGKFDGRVIKHVGDALIIYFPATSDPTNGMAFKSTLDCGMAMLEAQGPLNSAFQEENLPSLSYRISADYGRMEPIETQSSASLDWIGPSMNMVAKMNRLARTNSMVIGGDLHQILSKLSFQEYVFDFAGELNIGIKQKYPVYSITRRKQASAIISSNETDNFRTPTIRLAKNGGTESTTTGAELPNVVIVDDEHDILLVYKKYLSGQPINVEIFADPVQLLGRLAEVGPSYYDLAILDIRMPRMNGFQVHQILTALKPNIKTLFVSALDYAGEVLSGLRGIDKEQDFIRKPVSRDNFVCAVNKKVNL